MNFINAVRVVARRDATPAASFLRGFSGTRIFGSQQNRWPISGCRIFETGGRGSAHRHCKQSIVDASGNYTCNTGRMINSSGGTTTNSAAWTNFTPVSLRNGLGLVGSPPGLLRGKPGTACFSAKGWET